MLTMLDDDESVQAALQAGAAGHVLKGIFVELGVTNRTEAALVAQRAGLCT